MCCFSNENKAHTSWLVVLCKQTNKGRNVFFPLLMVSRVKSYAVICLNQNPCSTIMLHSQNQGCLGTFSKMRMLVIHLQSVPELVDSFWLQTIVTLNCRTTPFSNFTTHSMPQTESQVSLVFFYLRFLLELATC